MPDQVRDDATKLQLHYIYSNPTALHQLLESWPNVTFDLQPSYAISRWLGFKGSYYLAGAFVSLMLSMRGTEEEPRMDTAFTFLASCENSCRELTKAYLYGSEKYTRGNFKNGAAVCSYADAALRHMHKITVGEEIDPESKLLHRAHAAWNIWQALDQPPERDNRLHG